MLPYVLLSNIIQVSNIYIEWTCHVSLNNSCNQSSIMPVQATIFILGVKSAFTWTIDQPSWCLESRFFFSSVAIYLRRIKKWHLACPSDVVRNRSSFTFFINTVSSNHLRTVLVLSLHPSCSLSSFSYYPVLLTFVLLHQWLHDITYDTVISCIGGGEETIVSLLATVAICSW